MNTVSLELFVCRVHSSAGQNLLSPAIGTAHVILEAALWILFQELPKIYNFHLLPEC